MSRGFTAWLALLLLAITGTATAQDVPETPPLATFSISLSASPSNDMIVPITGKATTSVDVTVTCEQGSIYTGTTPAETSAQIQYTVNTTYPAASVSASPLSTGLEFTPEGCLQGMELTDTLVVDVSLAQGARHEDAVPIEVTATLDDGTTERLAWNHIAGLYYNHQATLDGAVHKTAPGASLEVPGKVSNFGNAAIRFVFDELPDDARRLKISMPDPMVVAPFTKDQAFTITVEAHGSDSYTNRRDQVDMRVQALLDADPNVAGDPMDLAFIVQTQGGAGEASGPVLPFLVVFGAALWAGRRRTCSTV